MNKSLLITIAFIKMAYAIVGYDCGARSLNVTTISLLEVGVCEEPIVNLNTTKQYIQLLQINEFSDNLVFQCKIEISRTIYYCGMHSHVSIVQNGQMEYLYDISQRTCEDAHLTGTLRLGYSHIISGLRHNQTSTYPTTLAGYLSTDGRCNGAAYADPYGSWESVVVQGHVKVTLHQQLARVNLENNKIHLSSGTTCSLRDGYCIDSENGHSFWHTLPRDTCKLNKYGVLYEGYAHKMTDSDFGHKQVVYSLASNDVTFALSATTTENVCGYTIIKTEHPRLVIFETVQGENFAPKQKISVNNLDIFAYVNSKFIYVERHIRGQLKNLYRDIVLQRCKIERKTLKNALAIATQAPDEFAYNLMKGPGYMSVVAGEVAHIVKCVPVEVKVEQSDECYAELRVNRRNQTYYLTPKTRILKKHGTKTTCNKILPAYYLIDSVWYKITPSAVEVKEPTIIQPMKNPTWKYINPANLATSGIYTFNDLDELRERIMFPIEQPAILNDVAREMSSQPFTDKEGTISKLLNEEAVEKIVVTAWTKVWGKLTAFGTASAGVIAILMIIQTLKIIIEVIMNGYALHRIYGWSLHLVAAIWNSAAYLLLSLNKGPRAPQNQDEEIGYVSHSQLRDEPKESNESPSISKEPKLEFFKITP